jgi:hypothetical protein
MSALARIRSTGFEVWLKDNGNIGIKPFDALTPQQLEFVKTHKAEIVKELIVIDASSTHPTSEAEPNAQGRFFKFLITRPDGSQFYSCSMPRQTLTEVREQYPDAATIQPIENEDYPNDE